MYKIQKKGKEEIESGKWKMKIQFGKIFLKVQEAILQIAMLHYELHSLIHLIHNLQKLEMRRQCRWTLKYYL